MAHRWTFEKEGVALLDLFATNVADPHNDLASYMGSIREAHPQHFDNVIPRDFRTNYRRYADEFLADREEEAKHAARLADFAERLDRLRAVPANDGKNKRASVLPYCLLLFDLLLLTCSLYDLLFRGRCRRRRIQQWH
jgi:hypothetical protein